MEITPVTPAGRTAKVRPAKSAVPKPSKAAPAITAKPAAPPRKSKALAKQQEYAAAPDLAAAIAKAAYYLAERRQFAPGYELEDWLAAEQQLMGGTSK